MRVFAKLTALLLLAVSAGSAAEEHLRLATTTSAENTGLLAVLNPPFEQQHGVKVDVIAVGTGKALKLAENGDVDVVLVHAPKAESSFVNAGFGIERLPLMHNDFVLLGPPGDPAHVSGSQSAAEAMSRVRNRGGIFVSRGDESGTHIKERELWRVAGIEPGGAAYLSAGQGMGAVLIIANDKQAYTLSDRATWLTYADRVDLGVVFEGAPELLNPYHIILVNPARHPHVKAEMAARYAAWLRGADGQRIIREFKVSGQQLFVPDVIP